MKEFKIVTSRGSGPGGQHKNKVETCVIITHVATGMSETCQESRSQLKNKNLAMSRLLVRIAILKKNKQHKLLNEQRKLSFKERIRTYNYKSNIVTDHRSGKKANLEKLMNGELNLLS